MASPVSANSPAPVTIQTRAAASVPLSSARATAAVTAAASPAMPSTIGSFSWSVSPTSAKAAAPANAGAASARTWRWTPIGSTPTNAPSSSRSTVTEVQREESVTAAHQPASNAIADATPSTSPQTGPPPRFVSGAEGPRRRGFADESVGDRCRVVLATRTSPLSTPPSTSGTSAASGWPSWVEMSGIAPRPAWAAYSRATSVAAAPGGTRRSIEPRGPCTVRARWCPSLPRLPTRLAMSGRLVALYHRATRTTVEQPAGRAPSGHRLLGKGAP